MISYVIYFLASHADITRKLRDEIIQAYGTNGQPSIEDMKDLKYCMFHFIHSPVPLLNYKLLQVRAVINETMRLFPPVPLNIRQANGGLHAFPASENSPKYYVPPNSVILYTIFLIQRRKDLWGEDALDFRPERWLEPDCAKRLADNPFMYTPFHAGPRLVSRIYYLHVNAADFIQCLGQNFAYSEMSVFLILVMQRFERFELAPDAQPGGSLPPPRWKHGRGRQAIEKIWPASALTAFIKVHL